MTLQVQSLLRQGPNCSAAPRLQMGGYDKECRSSLPLLLFQRAQAPADLPDGLPGRFRVQCHQQKYFASPFGRNRFMDSAIPSHTEGRFAIVTDVGHGMRWTRQRFARDGIAGRVERLVSDHRHADERCCLRTAKSCGPDAPTLASSSRDGKSALPGADKSPIRGRRWQKSPVTGESTT